MPASPAAQPRTGEQRFTVACSDNKWLGVSVLLWRGDVQLIAPVAKPLQVVLTSWSGDYRQYDLQIPRATSSKLANKAQQRPRQTRILTGRNGSALPNATLLPLTPPQYALCGNALQGLAKSIAWDGEGATCLMEVTCRGATDEAAANAVARSIAGSSLVKAAVYGHDPNWGRIACAAG